MVLQRIAYLIGRCLLINLAGGFGTGYKFLQDGIKTNFARTVVKKDTERE
jgi:hypothetical protein